MKVARSIQGESYVATVHHKNMKKSVELHSGSILIETDPGVIEADKNLGNEAS